jgi:hypothetical protein
VKVWLRHARPLLAAAVGALILAACDEKLEAGAACPALCPQQAIGVRDTTMFAVGLDTSIRGYPPIGEEPRLVLAAMGDTFDARAIVRFDSLPRSFFHKGGDSLITEVLDARLALHLAAVDTLSTTPVTFEVYDVDVADDTAAAVLLPAFRPDRFLGSTTVVLSDTSVRSDSSFNIPLDSAKILARIQADTSVPHRLRIGIRVTSAASVQAQIYTTNATVDFAAHLSFLPSADTGVSRIEITPVSKTPTSFGQLAADLSDFQLVAKQPPLPGVDILRVGGVPGWRVYFRFDIPDEIIDSSNVVRATLLITQHANPSLPEARDSLAFAPYAVTSAAAVTDIARALTFITGALDSISVAPADGGLISIEVIGIVGHWRNTTIDRTPRAIALSAALEGARPWQIEFFSNEAPDAVRPRLRLSYIPKAGRGLP